MSPSLLAHWVLAVSTLWLALLGPAIDGQQQNGGSQSGGSGATATAPQEKSDASKPEVKQTPEKATEKSADPTDKTTADKTAADKTAADKTAADKTADKTADKNTTDAADPKTDAADATAEPAKPATAADTKFLRLRRDAGKDPVAMETAITRYVTMDAKGEVIVDLIGAVHVGEKEYYEDLNERFTKYDALLYELVAPEGARPQAGRRSGNPISALQTGLKRLLNLEFQLDCIDYGKENFVHADMTPQEFSKSMKDRGESIWKMLFKMMGQSMAMQSKRKTTPSDAELLMALMSKDRSNKMKRIMAEQFEDLDAQLAMFNGPDGSTIVTERNIKALRVLTRELKNGKRRIGIFYGAAHLPDMEERLEKEFGLKKSKQEWLIAWSLED